MYMNLSETNWRKSSRSTGGGNQCVEVARLCRSLASRASKEADAAARAIRAEHPEGAIRSKRGAPEPEL